MQLIYFIQGVGGQTEWGQDSGTLYCMAEPAVGGYDNDPGGMLGVSDHRKENKPSGSAGGMGSLARYYVTVTNYEAYAQNFWLQGGGLS